jgi:glucosyl-dolichyl phosphate glucuronosyltransferase
MVPFALRAGIECSQRVSRLALAEEFVQNTMKWTIAICTRNRSRSLKRVLDSIQELRLPAGHQFEMMVAANACTDDTEATVKASKQSFLIQLLVSAERGLSQARNRVLQATQSDWIIWLDDDVTVERELLQAYTQALNNDKDVAFMGGPMLAAFEGSPAAWIDLVKELFPSTFSEIDLGRETRVFDTAKGEFPYGGNFAVCRKKLGELRFREDLGRGSRLHCGGEETELLRRVSQTGAMGVWVPDARVQHWIPVERQSLRSVELYWQGIGAQQVRMGVQAPDHSRAMGWKTRKRWLIYKICSGFGRNRQSLKLLTKAMRSRGAWLESLAHSERYLEGVSLDPVA